MEMHAPLFTVVSPTCTEREIYTSCEEKAVMRDLHYDCHKKACSNIPTKRIRKGNLRKSRGEEMQRTLWPHRSRGEDDT